MVLIIKNKDSKVQDFLGPNVIIEKDLCRLKLYKAEPYVIVLLDVKIDNNGIIEGHDYFLEELLITLDVVAIITENKTDVLKQLCEQYKISLIGINEYS